VVLGQQPTPSQTPSPTFNPTPIPTLSPSIEERIKTLEQKLKQNESNPKPKDVWDKLNAVSGLISGGVVAIIGILATYIYNERQRKNAEKQNQNEINILQVQTVQGFMSFLSSENPRTVEVAILSIEALGNSALAIKIASLYRTEGALSALSKISASTDKEAAERARKSLSDIFKSLRESVVEIRNDDHLVGSGFIVKDDGYIVTANFVIRDLDPSSIKIFSGEKMYQARRIKENSDSNLALLKIDNATFPSLEIVEDPKADPLDEIYILGPRQDLKDWMIITGKIIGKGKGDIINTSAEIYPGVAGSPAVNQYGQVIGMAFATSSGRLMGGKSSLLIPASHISKLIAVNST
jgi:hypothetical protein